MGHRNRAFASLVTRPYPRYPMRRLHAGRPDAWLRPARIGPSACGIRKPANRRNLLFTRYDHNVCSFSLSPDGLMLARGSHNKDIKIWEVTTGTELMTLLGKDQYDHHWSVCVAFSPDGMHLASGTDIGKIKLWEVLTQRRGKNPAQRTLEGARR